MALENAFVIIIMLLSGISGLLTWLAVRVINRQDNQEVKLQTVATRVTVLETLKR